ncbi:MAG: hypothetical protein IJB04_07970 [Oscillospiraceae bacterium]|nr:hypothetical protein [Oscillospiraceae bacterium]
MNTAPFPAQKITLYHITKCGEWERFLLKKRKFSVVQQEGGVRSKKERGFLGKKAEKGIIIFVQHKEKIKKIEETTKRPFTYLTHCDNIDKAGIPCEYQVKYTKFRRGKRNL